MSLLDLCKSYSDLVPGLDTTSRHIRGMLVTLPHMEDSAKLNRWLGFVQGFLWQCNLRTISQMRADVTGLNDRRLTPFPQCDIPS